VALAGALLTYGAIVVVALTHAHRGG